MRKQVRLTLRQDGPIRLTAREQQVLALVVAGRNYREIAAALGRKPFGLELQRPDIHQGISIFDDAEVAGEKLLRAKSIDFLAELDVPEDLGMIEKTGGPSHYTWWVDPAKAVQTVVRVFRFK